MKAVSLFASSGIGDLALNANGIDVVVANEVLADRADLFSSNYPATRMIVGDVWAVKDQVIAAARQRLNGEQLDFVLATPPCQGMSKNGMGKLLQGVRNGARPPLDPRNRLIIPTMDIVVALRPVTVVFENVPEMQNTLIETETGALMLIVDYIAARLGPAYSGGAEVVEFADYGVPERRQRLVTIFTRDGALAANFARSGTMLPYRSHSVKDDGVREAWRTVRDAIGHLPALDGKQRSSATSDFHPLHRVPVLDPKKYRWIASTPPGKGAFDNQCENAACLFQGNQVHGSRRTEEGINRASSVTPLYCTRCDALLPRPFTEVAGEKRIMKGFTSAYRRMKWDLPAPTLTTNLSYPSSDQNLHPDQNRVLSLFEALELHTVNHYAYEWTNRAGESVSDTLIRDSIGESIPPRGLDIIFQSLVREMRAADQASGMSAA